MKVYQVPTAQSMYDILAALMDSMEQELVSWAEENQMSLGTILGETPQLHQVVTTFLGNLPEVAGWLLYAPINNAQKLSEMLASPNLLEYLCDSSVSEISQIYKIPASINMTQFYTAICRVDSSALSREVLDGFGLTKMIDHINRIVNNTIQESVDFSVFSAKLQNNADAITRLINNPPSFLPIEVDTDGLQAVFDEFLKSLMDPEVKTDELLSAFWPLTETLYGPEATDLLASYLELTRVYADFGNHLLASIQRNGGSLKLVDLFHNKTRLMMLLRRGQIPEDMIGKVVNLKAKPDMVRMFFS